MLTEKEHLIHLYATNAAVAYNRDVIVKQISVYNKNNPTDKIDFTYFLQYFHPSFYKYLDSLYFSNYSPKNVKLYMYNFQKNLKRLPKNFLIDSENSYRSAGLFYVFISYIKQRHSSLTFKDIHGNVYCIQDPEGDVSLRNIYTNSVIRIPVEMFFFGYFKEC